MDLTKIYLEEDLFPKAVTSWVERPYGYLFYNEDNKSSYDSNHAIIFRDRVVALESTLDEILRFYKEKGIPPCIYQSISDDGYFEEIGDALSSHGFKFWTEAQKYMVLLEENRIRPQQNITVRNVKTWDDAFASHIFEAAGEPWETQVAKNALRKQNTLFFAAYDGDIPVGMTYAHAAGGVCRVDYLLVAKAARNKGVGRALIYHFAEYCKENNIKNCYLWPDGDTAEKIYQEAGFRTIAVKRAGRAMLQHPD